MMNEQKKPLICRRCKSPDLAEVEIKTQLSNFLQCQECNLVFPVTAETLQSFRDFKSCQRVAESQAKITETIQAQDPNPVDEQEIWLTDDALRSAISNTKFSDRALELIRVLKYGTSHILKDESLKIELADLIIDDVDNHIFLLMEGL